MPVLQHPTVLVEIDVGQQRFQLPLAKYELKLASRNVLIVGLLRGKDIVVKMLAQFDGVVKIADLHCGEECLVLRQVCVRQAVKILGCTVNVSDIVRARDHIAHCRNAAVGAAPGYL